MSRQTTKFGWTVPTATDPPVIATDIGSLGDQVDATLGQVQTDTNQGLAAEAQARNDQITQAISIEAGDRQEQVGQLNNTITEGFATINNAFEGFEGRIEALEELSHVPDDITVLDLIASNGFSLAVDGASTLINFTWRGKTGAPICILLDIMNHRTTILFDNTLRNQVVGFEVFGIRLELHVMATESSARLQLFVWDSIQHDWLVGLTFPGWFIGIDAGKSAQWS